MIEQQLVIVYRKIQKRTKMNENVKQFSMVIPPRILLRIKNPTFRLPSLSLLDRPKVN